MAGIADSTPGDGYVLNSQPYVFTDNKGTAVPAMRDPTTNKWVPDQARMAQGGMKQLGSAAAAPEDDAALKKMVGAVDPLKERALAERDFMDLQGQLQGRGYHTGQQWGALPIFGGNAQEAHRRALAAKDPATEALLEQMEAINSRNWPMLRPEGSGRILGSETGQGQPASGAGWKTAFPSIVTADAANKGMSDRDWQAYANASNESDFVQNWVHSGKGTYAAGQAAFQNMQRSPAAAGRKQALGAAPGDFSGRQPGWTAQIPPKQLAAAKLFANAKAPPGDRENPLLAPVAKTRADVMNFARAHPGAWILDDDGTRVQLPGGR